MQQPLSSNGSFKNRVTSQVNQIGRKIRSLADLDPPELAEGEEDISADDVGVTANHANRDVLSLKKNLHQVKGC